MSSPSYNSLSHPCIELQDVDRYDKNHDGLLDKSEVEELINDIVIKKRKEKLLKMLLISSLVLAVLFCAAVFGLTYAVVAAAKDTQVTNQVMVTTSDQTPVRFAQPTAAATLEPLPTGDAAIQYLRSAYPPPLYNVTSDRIIYSLLGGYNYYWFAHAQVPLSEVAATCQMALNEGQSSLSVSSIPFIGISAGVLTSINMNFVRIIGCQEAIDALNAGNSTVSITADAYRTDGYIVIWQSCHSDGTCDQFLRLDSSLLGIPTKAPGNGTTPAPVGRRRQLLSTEEVHHGHALGSQTIDILGGPMFGMSMGM